MNEWILVIFIYAGILSKGDSVAIQSVPGWTNQTNCEKAGKQLGTLVSGTFKDVRYVCLQK